MAASEVVAEDLAEAARAAAGKILLVCIGRGKSSPTSALRCVLPFLRGLRPQAPAFHNAANFIQKIINAIF